MVKCIRRPHSVWTTCPCDDCARDRRRMTKLQRNGAYRRVPSDAAWDVIDRLTERGWSALAIASATGLSWKGVQEALTTARRTGERRTFGPRTTLQIINHGDPTEGSVGIVGTRRRLQGLARQGWDLQRLADLSGVGFSTLAAARNSPTKHCRAWVYLAVRELAERIGMEVGPSEQARECAAKHGWPGVLAWDDIDNPDERPASTKTREVFNLTRFDEVVIRRVLAGESLRTTPDEKREIMRRWLEAGNSEHSLCARMGWKEGRYSDRVGLGAHSQDAKKEAS